MTHELYSSDSVTVAHRLSCSTACEISQTRDQTCIPCFGKWILIPCIITEVLLLLFLCKLSQSPIYSLSDLILFLETRPGKPSWEQLSVILTPIMSCPYTSVLTHQRGHPVICRHDSPPLWGYKLHKDKDYFIPILCPLQCPIHGRYCLFLVELNKWINKRMKNIWCWDYHYPKLIMFKIISYVFRALLFYSVLHCCDPILSFYYLEGNQASSCFFVKTWKDYVDHRSQALSDYKNLYNFYDRSVHTRLVNSFAI